MSKFLSLTIILLVFSCKSEEWYYKRSFENLDNKLVSSDTVIYAYKGKSNQYQHWKGNLIAFYNNDNLIIREYGEWVQYNPDVPAEIWTTTMFDTLGLGLVQLSEVYNSQTNELHNQVICKDAIINKIDLRKCDYKWYYDNGQLNIIYSLITFGNPGAEGKLYGNKIIYDESGNIESIEFSKSEVISK